MLDQIDQLRREVAELKGMLREIEWSAPSGYQEETPQGCLFCGSERFFGHGEGCRLAAVLGMPAETQLPLPFEGDQS